ncbi:hypothetical protein ABT369_39150 [Dactylosporangium sp. NPDC000244]|uniref:hypothetical protein n=1 Tax=Dactylosporangium sp. NPDC000244 TaxID=3154365 RepID=UPI003334A1BE
MLVFDATALAALFDAYQPVWALWRTADQDLGHVGFPALAIVEAGGEVGAPASAWDSILWSKSVTVLPLSERAAVEISAWSGTFGARHALWEALALDCPLITRRPELYAPGHVEIRAV